MPDRPVLVKGPVSVELPVLLLTTWRQAAVTCSCSLPNFEVNSTSRELLYLPAASTVSCNLLTFSTGTLDTDEFPLGSPLSRILSVPPKGS
jgi:hypothetical protein